METCVVRACQARASLLAGLAFACLAGPAREGWAAGQAHFDMPATVACRDVTPEDFLVANPQERLLEAHFSISALLENTAKPDRLQLYYRLDCPAYGVEVADFLPRTTLASDHAGPVTIERKTESAKTLGLALNGTLPWAFTANGSGAINAKDSTCIKYDLLPPLEMVSAAGTLNRRTGVYFKLQATPRTSLEGDRDFVIVLRVPATWRGQYVRVRCQAIETGERPGRPFESSDETVIGDRLFQVALYREGDGEARAIAVRFVQHEQALRYHALLQQRQIEKQALPTVAHKVGAMFTVVDPKIPENWLELLIQAPASAPLASFSRRLPSSVRKAAEQYAQAKRALAALSRPDVNIARQ